jgi:hypothetical protein
MTPIRHSQLSLVFPVLAGAPAATDAATALVAVLLWLGFVSLSGITQAIAMRWLAAGSADFFLRLIVCLTAAAASMTIAPLLSPLSSIWFVSIVLLALVAAAAPPSSVRELGACSLLVVFTILIVGVLRTLLPPMTPVVAAAVALAVLAGLLALRPHSPQNPADDPEHP